MNAWSAYDESHWHGATILAVTGGVLVLIGIIMLIAGRKPPGIEDIAVPLQG